VIRSYIKTTSVLPDRGCDLANMYSKIVLIVHGGWHVPAHMQPLVKQLESRGYETVCPELLSSNNDVPPTKGLADDTTLIRNVATDLTQKQGRDVVALMHSYGGIVGTGALAGLGKKSGGGGGVVRLIYMCAFMPFENQSLMGIFGGGVPPWCQVEPDGRVVCADPVAQFYADVDDPQPWVDRLVAHPHAVQRTPIGDSAAWRDIPVSYIVCDADQACPAFLQEMMIGRLKDEKVDVWEERLPASHSPFLSMPEKLEGLLRDSDEEDGHRQWRLTSVANQK